MFSTMKKPLVSVVIPVYNGSKTIRECAQAVLNNSYKNFECIVVDDSSTDGSTRLIRDLDCKIYELNKNRGPAYARNFGMKKAKGSIIFFVDSDLILMSDALCQVVKTFNENENAYGVMGIYSPKPANDTFVATIMAIKKYTDYIGVKKLTFVGEAINALRKDMLMEMGGFNTNYKGADVEGYELGHRIPHDKMLLFNSKVQGRHHFPSFWKVCKNYHKRAGQWMALFIRRKKFDSGAASGKGGLSSVISLFVMLTFIISLVYPTLFILFVAFLLLFCFLNDKFIKYSLKQEGLLFTIRAIPVLVLLNNAALFGASVSLGRHLFGLKNKSLL